MDRRVKLIVGIGLIWLLSLALSPAQLHKSGPGDVTDPRASEMFPGGAKKKITVAASSCSVAIQQTEQNDYSPINTIVNAQKIQSHAGAVCQVDIYCRWSSNMTVTLQLTSAASGVSTVYATATNEVSITADAWAQFTINPTWTPTGDYYICAFRKHGTTGDSRWYKNTDNTKYLDTNYDQWYNGVDNGDDNCFKIYTQ